MFLLLGTHPVTSVTGLVTFVCGHCGTRAPQRIIRRQQRFTLFFVPLFSFRTSWSVECDHCGIATGLTRQQAQHPLEWARQRGHAVG